MCGQEGYFGTSSFSLYLNVSELKNESTYKSKETDDLDILFSEDDSTCSMKNLKITHNLTTENIELKEDNQYELEL
jgi:hypothetical protein